MPERKARIGAIALAAVVVVSMFAPAAAGATTASEELAVSTEEPTVTETTAMFQANLTALGNATNATLSFEYWPENDTTNTTSAAVGTVNETGTYDVTVDGLSADTTYVVVAEANSSDGETATGEEVTFATDGAFDVRTDAATNVNERSATLQGTLTDLDGASNATVWFEYWQQGNAGNATSTAGESLNQTGAFSADVSGLASDVTYVYVAYAEPADGDEAEAGGEVTFDTVVEEREDEDQPFGQRLSAYLNQVMNSPYDGPLGVYISEWVTANNPGADNKPAHAGQSGPPDHANNGDGSGDEDEVESESGEDDERGPPDHANNDKDDEDDDRGNGKSKGNGEK